MKSEINIEEIIRDVLFTYSFLGSTLANIEIAPDYNCFDFNGNPTAAASKTKIKYHPDFVSNLDREERTFLFAHELMHIHLKHHERSKDRNPKIWNIATDAVINTNLKKDGFKLIDGLVDIPEAINYSAEQYYQKLMNQKQKQKNSKNNQKEKNNHSPEYQNSQDFKQYDVGHDTHSGWYQEETKDLPNGKDCSEKEIFQKNRQELKQKLKKLRKQLVNQMINAGNNTDEQNLKLDNIGEASNLLNWKQLLYNATKIEEDWSFINATIEYGVVIPHIEEQPKPKTEIVIDTSSSVSDNIVRSTLRECKTILQTSEISVGCFDTKFYGFQVIKTQEDIDNFPIIGRGGTDFEVAVNAFTGKAENKIIFTDGCASMPKTEVKAIWIAYGDNKINPPGGKVIYISEEDIKKLSLTIEEPRKIR